MTKERQVAIVGVGQTDFGALYRTRDAFRDAYARHIDENSCKRTGRGLAIRH